MGVPDSYITLTFNKEFHIWCTLKNKFRTLLALLSTLMRFHAIFTVVWRHRYGAPTKWWHFELKSTFGVSFSLSRAHTLISATWTENICFMLEMRSRFNWSWAGVSYEGRETDRWTGRGRWDGGQRQNRSVIEEKGWLTELVKESQRGLWWWFTYNHSCTAHWAHLTQKFRKPICSNFTEHQPARLAFNPAIVQQS